ncbi:MAG: efflux RND transporter periplasmic adaptor subunit [Gammaproteobacteria bacterium]|jgi:membrane fusion protein (multidrug efflux system)
MLKKFLMLLTIVTAFSPVCMTYSKEKLSSEPVKVKTVKIKYQKQKQQLIAIGTLVGMPGIVVRSEVSGRVTKIYFKSGERVKMGAPLLKLDYDDVNARLAQAQARLDLAKLQLGRYRKLYKKHFFSKDNFDKSKTDLATYQAEVAQYKAELKKRIILAPFSGNLGIFKVNIGDYIGIGQDIVSLNSLNPIGVDFSIPELYLSKISVGQEVLLKSDSYPNENFEGKVIACESKIDQSTRTLKIRASVINKRNELLPGGFVKVVLRIGRQLKIITIPQIAVIYSVNGDYVYRVVGNKAQKTKIVLAGNYDEQDVVTSGLKVGDKIVVAGQLKIHNGSLISVVNNH